VRTFVNWQARTRGRVARWLALTVLASATLLPTGRLSAQEVTGPSLTAAFLFNFVKFTTWPDEALPPNAPVTMCVLNDPVIDRALRAQVAGKEVLGHRIQIVGDVAPDALPRCHVLYVSGQRAAVASAVAAVRDLPVLTVSDAHAFDELGGIVQLHVQRGQLRFAISTDAARRARLQLSARLLALARQP
jgi:hypothetical protein